MPRFGPGAGDNLGDHTATQTLQQEHQQIAALKQQAVVLRQRAAQSEAHALHRLAQAEAAVAGFEQRLRVLETNGSQADARP